MLAGQEQGERVLRAQCSLLVDPYAQIIGCLPAAAEISQNLPPLAGWSWLCRGAASSSDKARLTLTFAFSFLWLKFLWLALRMTSTAPRRRVKGPNWMKKTWKALSRWGEKAVCAQLVFHRVCGLLMFVVCCCFGNCGHHFSAAMWMAPDKQLLQ